MREKIFSAVVVFLLAAVPIVLLPFPPVTDLPQHIGQLLTAIEHAHDASGPFVILWGAPNTLCYGFLYLLERVFSLAVLGRAVLLAMTASWIIAIYTLAARRRRPPETALLASLFLFNISFYWGFLNFWVGFPVFIAWFFLTTRRDPKAPVGWIALLVLTSFLLYGSHMFWLFVGGLWFGLISLVRRLPFRALVIRAATLIPAGLLTIFWFMKFSVYQTASELDKAAEWSTPPFEKFFTLWFRDSAFGGGAGYLETILFYFVLAWIAAAVFTNRKELKQRIDSDLLILAGLLFVISFFAPDMARNTIYVSGRWVAPFFIFLILALPAPRVPAAVRKSAAAAAVLAFFLVTTQHWIAFDRTELAGFRESLAAIPKGAHLLCLDFAKGSRYFKYRPFLQIYAYAQIFRGADLAYPFAYHGTGLVAFREPFKMPWKNQLDWYPDHAQGVDILHFDYVLVNGTPYHHGHRLPKTLLTPVTAEARWRLYRVEGSGPR